MTNELTLHELAAREAIRETMARYYRGIDRCDVALLRTVFWPDGNVRCGDNPTGGFDGPAYEFIDWGVGNLSQADQTMHMMGNILIELDGDYAGVETYAQCYHRLPDPANGPKDVVVGVRYVDRFERRDGEWRVMDRLMLFDWWRDYGDSADWAAGFIGMAVKPGETLGGRWPDDPSYAQLAAGRAPQAPAGTRS